jgi:hypothetical protein
MKYFTSKEKFKFKYKVRILFQPKLCIKEKILNTVKLNSFLLVRKITFFFLLTFLYICRLYQL